MNKFFQFLKGDKTKTDVIKTDIKVVNTDLNKEELNRLIKTIREESGQRRYDALQSLKRFPYKDGDVTLLVDALFAAIRDRYIETLCDSYGNIMGEAPVSKVACDYLEELIPRSNNVIPSLIDALRNQNNQPYKPERIISLLVKTGDLRVLKPIIQYYIAKEKDIEIGDIESDIESTESLLSTIDESKKNKDEIISVLSQFKEPQITDVLLRFLENENETNGYYRALEALGKRNDPRCVAKLAQQLKNDSYTDVAIRALGEVGTPEAFDALSIAKNNPDTRELFVKTLKKFNTEGAVQLAIEALKDPDKEVRNTAAMVLKEIGNGRCLDALIKALQDQDRYVRSSAIDAIQALSRKKLADPQLVVKGLSGVLEDESVREQAIEALGSTKNELIIEPLVGLLSDKKYYVRKLTIEALGNTGSRRVVRPLIDRLNILQHERDSRDEEKRITFFLQEITKGLNDKAFPSDWLVWWKSNQRKYK